MYQLYFWSITCHLYTYLFLQSYCILEFYVSIIIITGSAVGDDTGYVLSSSDTGSSILVIIRNISEINDSIHFLFIHENTVKITHMYPISVIAMFMIMLGFVFDLKIQYSKYLSFTRAPIQSNLPIFLKINPHNFSYLKSLIFWPPEN